jgi:hypothetical protein
LPQFRSSCNVVITKVEEYGPDMVLLRLSYFYRIASVSFFKLQKSHHNIAKQFLYKKFQKLSKPTAKYFPSFSCPFAGVNITKT